MPRFLRWLQTYLICALPLVLACIIWHTVAPERTFLKDAVFLTRAAWELLAWNLMLWFAALVLFLALLVVWPAARERTLRRLANLKERDEREQYITGRASRAAYVSTLSLLVFLLFFSIFSVHVRRLPESQVANGRKSSIAIGLRFSLLDRPRADAAPAAGQAGRVLFDSGALGLSKTGLILVALLWQLATFNLAARRERGREADE